MTISLASPWQKSSNATTARSARAPLRNWRLMRTGPSFINNRSGGPIPGRGVGSVASVELGPMQADESLPLRDGRRRSRGPAVVPTGGKTQSVARQPRSTAYCEQRAPSRFRAVRHFRTLEHCPGPDIRPTPLPYRSSPRVADGTLSSHLQICRPRRDRSAWQHGCASPRPGLRHDDCQAAFGFQSATSTARLAAASTIGCAGVVR